MGDKAVITTEDPKDVDRHLTKREREVLTLAGCGLNSRKIARRMWLAPSTVTTHLGRVRVKLGTHTVADAVKIALDAELIPVWWYGHPHKRILAEGTHVC